MQVKISNLQNQYTINASCWKLSQNYNDYGIFSGKSICYFLWST